MRPRSSAPRIELHGAAIAPGIAIGKAYLFRPIELDALEKNRFSVEDLAGEEKRLESATEKSRDQLHQIKQRTAEQGSPEAENIFAVHISMLRDSSFLGRIREMLARERANIEFVLAREIRSIQDRFASIKDEYLRRRFSDIEDVYFRLLRNLLEIEHVRTNPLQRIDTPVLFVAENLVPSDIPLLDMRKILGIVVERGDETSHAAIIAKSLGVPVVMRVAGISALARPDDLVIVDGYAGIVIIHPTESDSRYHRARAERLSAQAVGVRFPMPGPLTSADGTVLRVEANVSNANQAWDARRLGARGVGLLRTEFFYMAQATMPSLEEETAMIEEIARIHSGFPVTVRFLDLGADKSVPYIAFAQEENPQLGCRGIRFLLNHPWLLKKQTQSILRVSTRPRVRVLLPFVALVEELEKALDIIEEACREEGVDRNDLRIGMMVEIPSAALALRDFVDRVDFVSIGTNDLLQYTFAAGRENVQLENYKRVAHPVMLRLIAGIAEVAKAAHREVTLCGELQQAANAALLFGLGVDILSVSPQMLPELAAVLNRRSLETMRAAAQKALACRTAWDVDEILKEL